MSRTAGNIKTVCRDHAPKADPRWADKAPTFFKGKWVKKAFKADKEVSGFKPTIEHMWVKVLRVQDGKLVGTMANPPQFVNDLKFGQEVSLSVQEIEDVAEAAT